MLNLNTLNEEQIKPVCDTEGAVLVLAGAGSGKTRVLTSRIAYLVEEKGVYPSNILAITFTNKAAREMKERLDNMIDGSSEMWICTIHSMCVRILRRWAREVGLDDNFTIYDDTDRTTVIKGICSERGLPEEFVKNLKFHIGNAKMLGLSPMDYLRENAGEKDIDKICKLYQEYQTHLIRNNSCDFDDLLLLTLRLLQENKTAVEELSYKFKYIHVDEFQDTNAVQYEIVKYLSSYHGNLFVVGDDDQSIYGWRGAKIENILGFEKDFPKAKIYKLEQNYRSTKHILDLANVIIKNNSQRKSKQLWTENGSGDKVVYFQAESEGEEALYTARTIDKLLSKGYKYSDFAVLMRLNALTRSYEQEFTKYGIPYKVFGGFKFFERKEVKDLMCYLRLISNPLDSEAVLRIINVPKRGIGQKTVDTLREYADKNESTVFDALIDLDELNVTSGAKNKLSDFYEMIKRFVAMGVNLPLDELIKRVINESGIKLMYNDGSDESISKLANIDQFQAMIEEYHKLNPDSTLADYLNQAALSTDLENMDETEFVSLATIHSVKGLEFKVVFLCGLEEGTLPLSRAYSEEGGVEEERRLMYVAITRAKEKLFLTRSKSRFMYGKRSPTSTSCFVKEIGSELGLEDRRRPAISHIEDFSDDDFDDSYDSFRDSPYGSSDRSSYGSSYGSYDRSSGGYASSNSYNSWQSKPSYAPQSYNKPSGYGERKSNGNSQSAYGTTVGSRNTTSSAPTGYARTVTSYAQTPSSNDKAAKIARCKVGVRVRHPKFGDGTIVGVKDSGANTIITVDFATVGRKELSALLAPISFI